MTPEQEWKLRQAIGDGTEWPELTDDPEVNYEVDRAFSEFPLPPWADAPAELREPYLLETKLARFFKPGIKLIIFKFGISPPLEKFDS